MRAGVLHAPRDLRVQEWPDPVPGPDDVVVEVVRNGLCGTDATEYAAGPLMVPLTVAHPGSGHRGPTVLGHEFVGTVVAAGSAARLQVGQRVACGAGVSCGACAWCRAGRTNLCERYYTLGLSTHGGLAEFVAAPASTCVPIPDACDWDEAVLAQPLAVGIHAVAQSGPALTGPVVLLGVGAIGSFVCAALEAHEVEIVAVDVDQSRLDVARSLGAARTVLLPPGQDVDLRDVVRGAPTVFETSGAPGAASRAFSLVQRGGTVVLVGLAKGAQPVDLADLVLREVTVRTTVAHVCGSDLPAALDLLGRRPLARSLPVRTVSLDAVVEHGLVPLTEGRAGGKIVVDPRRG